MRIFCWFFFSSRKNLIVIHRFLQSEGAVIFSLTCCIKHTEELMLKVKGGVTQGGPAAAAVGARPGWALPSLLVASAAGISFPAQDSLSSHATL